MKFLKNALKLNLVLIITAITWAIFAFSIFNHLSYPLMWNDEADVAMYAKSVLKYGYPRVHFENNVLYLFDVPGIAIRQADDAFIGEMWGQYYTAAAGELLAQHTNDIYRKTALLRIPFALMGMAAVAVFSFALTPILTASRRKVSGLICLFIVWELMSIPLALHIREVHYYSLVLLSIAGLIVNHIHYAYASASNKYTYTTVFILASVLLFHSFLLAYFAMMATTIVWLSLAAIERWRAVRRQRIWLSPTKSLGTVVAAFLLQLIPVGLSAWYYQTPQLVITASYHYRQTLSTYLNNLSLYLGFFAKLDFLYLALIVKLWLWRTGKKSGEENKLLHPAKMASAFLTLLLVVYPLVVARTPHLYQRYFIALQPVFALMLTLDLWQLWERLRSRWQLPAVTVIIIIGVLLRGVDNFYQPTAGHVFELSHRYQGPLDAAIPYLAFRYQQPENLIIATNYEEMAYMYYLGSKVIVGYVGNNIRSDSLESPDVVIMRRGYLAYVNTLREFLRYESYDRLSFPIFDSMTNNIPEVDGSLPELSHQFQTKSANNSQDQVTIYVKSTNF